MTTNFKLTDEQFNKLFNTDTTRGEFKCLCELVSDRFNYIIQAIDKTIGQEREWFDFSNEGESDGENYDGYFDPERYKETIDFVGQTVNEANPDFDNYNNCFPTVWLKEDFETILQKQFDNFKQNEKSEKEKIKETEQKLKTDFEQAKESILKKLTPEELKYIQFNFSHKSLGENAKKLIQKEKEEWKREQKRLLAQPYIDAKNALKNKP